MMVTMIRQTAAAGCLMMAAVLPAAGQSAVDFPPDGKGAAWDNLTIALTQADGTVNVALATDPGAGRLEDLMGLLLMSAPDQVRFSTVYDPTTQQVTTAQRAMLERINGFISSHGVDWDVCNGWWMSPDSTNISASVADRFGGSIILIDNGPSSDAYDNPEADFMQARYDDPAFAGVFGDDARRVTDPEEYLAVAEAFFLQVMGQGDADADRLTAGGGWVDGC